MILTPNGRLIALPAASNSIKAEYAGVYQIRILAMDAAGNLGMVRHNVTVS
jgi:hypothetical protein